MPESTPTEFKLNVRMNCEHIINKCDSFGELTSYLTMVYMKGKYVFRREQLREDIKAVIGEEVKFTVPEASSEALLLTWMLAQQDGRIQPAFDKTMLRYLDEAINIICEPHVESDGHYMLDALIKLGPKATASQPETQEQLTKLGERLNESRRKAKAAH